MYVANISKFSDTYTVNRKKVVTTCGYPTLYPPQPIIIHHHPSSPVITCHRLSSPITSPSSPIIKKKTAYTLRASCDIITALSPAVSVRKRLLPNVTLSKPCSKAKRTSSIEKSPSGPTNTVISSTEEGCSSCEIAVKKSAREISG